MNTKVFKERVKRSVDYDDNERKKCEFASEMYLV